MNRRKSDELVKPFAKRGETPEQTIRGLVNFFTKMKKLRDEGFKIVGVKEQGYTLKVRPITINEDSKRFA
jgi:hypothetical protein